MKAHANAAYTEQNLIRELEKKKTLLAVSEEIVFRKSDYADRVYE